MKRSNYLGDGYTCPAFIKGVPLLYEDLRFAFRPALVEERNRLMDAMESLKGKTHVYAQRIAKEVAGKLVSWDVSDHLGKPVSVSALAVLNLHPSLFYRLYHVVFGFEPSEIDPEWAPEVKQEQADEQYDSALSGQSAGDVRQARDEKN